MKNIQTLISLIAAISLPSCVVDVPVDTQGGGHPGPTHYQGGGGPGYIQNGFNPGQGYRPSPYGGGGYNGGGQGYNGGYNYRGPIGAGQTIYHGNQSRHVYGNGPQSYAQWGQPRISYEGF